MTQKNKGVLTLENFKKSFFYGTRSDMNFKFMSMISDEKAGDFIQELLKKIIETHDTGEVNTLFDYVINAQKAAYSQEVKISYQDGPFVLMEKKVENSKILLFTSSGHFMKTDDPKPFGVDNMTQEQAESRIMDFIKHEPKLSAIPKATLSDDLMVRHGGYDIQGAKKDPNTVFPLEIFREFEQEKTIGALADTAFSFVGACSQKRLLKKTGPDWVEKIKAMDVDAVFLIPV